MLLRNAFTRSICAEGLLPMASVFLSYDHEDADRAGPIAAALEKAGHSVWWDRHIHGGAEYNSEIEGAVERAEAVVVLWSERSVKSAWVRDEAAEGRDNGKLVPVLLDRVKPPMGFRQYQTIDLSSWTGGKRIPNQQALLGAIEQVRAPLAGRPAAAAVAGTKPPGAVTARADYPFRPVLIAVALVIAAALALAAWRLTDRDPVPSVAVTAADSSAGSQELSRDLLNKLGSLQAAKAHSMRLAHADKKEGSSADFLFEVAASGTGQQARASLMLFSGKDRSLLWSRDFEQPNGNPADLRQQLAFTAARVLGCALEALPARGPRLSQQILKLYLGGCATLSEIQGVSPNPPVGAFLQVIKAEPRFEGAWAKLLLARTEVLGTEDDNQVRKQLKADIAAARKLNPDLPEAYQAEIDLLPYNAFAERMRVADRAVARNPNSAVAHAARAGVLQFIGRNDDAVAEAAKAAELDPLSPAMQGNYINVLVHSGRLATARKKLEEAERLWPGASSVTGNNFAIDLRYGDPKAAWEAIESGQVGSGWADARSFLEARMNPTRANVDKAIASARQAAARNPEAKFHLVLVLGEFDRKDELHDLLNSMSDSELAYIVDVMFRPMMSRWWRDPRSLLYAKRIGLLQYWQSSGKWPDFCFEPDLPYDCKAETAKLG